MTEPRSATIKVGYEQFVPPPVPPGMWFDRDRWLILPRGELLMGPLIWLGSKELNSVGDVFAGTLVLYDPNQLLHR